eukprot:TRINITY_DN15446_c0_g1_i2.p1 TRINITY_DN15446_c0_g1~~TRINITY_DN15446_c0_g1_i2.p1  ORF type:complete len:298 (-),score=69.71 TRINITY_DN15446_c0_g1_i2:224-1117(-)
MGLNVDGKFQRRWFVLKEGELSYFKEDKTTFKKRYTRFSRKGVPKAEPGSFEFFIKAWDEDGKEGTLINIRADNEMATREWIEALEAHQEQNEMGPMQRFAQQIELATDRPIFESVGEEEIESVIAGWTDDAAAAAWHNFRDQLVMAGFTGFEFVQETQLSGNNSREPIQAMFDVAVYGNCHDEVAEFTGESKLNDIDYFLSWKPSHAGRACMKKLKSAEGDQYTEAVLTDQFLSGLRNRITMMCRVADTDSHHIALDMEKVHAILFETTLPSEYDALRGSSCNASPEPAVSEEESQ